MMYCQSTPAHETKQLMGCTHSKKELQLTYYQGLVQDCMSLERKKDIYDMNLYATSPETFPTCSEICS